QRAIGILRVLLVNKVVVAHDTPEEWGNRLELTMELQTEFTLNQPMSPFALAAFYLLDLNSPSYSPNMVSIIEATLDPHRPVLTAFELLDPNSPSYAVDMVSIIEATLEPPRQVLTAQLRKLRDEEMARMRADGLEYNEHMNVLDNLTYPQPLGELLNQQFELYRQGAPWLAEFELQPKSVVRDMYERAMGFGDYVNYYGIARS